MQSSSDPPSATMAPHSPSRVPKAPAPAASWHRYTEPTGNDIKLGKGKECFNHIGNRRFRALIGACCQRYHACKARYGKRLVVTSVSQFLQSQNCRFLKFEKTTSKWYIAPLKEGNEKIGHAIRDTINFRLGISLRNLGHEEKKEVSYEIAQDLLSGHDPAAERTLPPELPADTGGGEFEEDIAMMKSALSTFFEDDFYPAKKTTKVQQSMMNRVKLTASISSSGTDDREVNPMRSGSDAEKNSHSSFMQSKVTASRRKPTNSPGIQGPLKKRTRRQSLPISDGLVLLSSATGVEDTISSGSAMDDDGNQLPSKSDVDAAVGILSAMKQAAEEKQAAASKQTAVDVRGDDDSTVTLNSS
jgi:hypothetical protein